MANTLSARQRKSPNPKIRTAIIGYGESGKLSHAYGINANSEFIVTAVCDLSQTNREQAKAELGCKTYSAHQELLENENDLDLISVVTRSDTHCSIVCDCLNSGIHTLVTKPWALNRQEAELILRARNSSGKRIYPWLPMYWSPEFIKIRELLKDGAIGKVFSVRRQIAQFSRRDDWQTKRQYGGGYLLNWGMHIVQPILALVESPAQRVYGTLQQTINPGDADDNFLAIIEFENGVRGIAEFTQSIAELPSFLLQGTGGTIRSNGRKIVLSQRDPASSDAAKETAFDIEGKIFGDEANIYRDVAANLLRNLPFEATPDAAYYGTTVIDAIRESHETHQSIRLSYSPEVSIT